MLKHVTLALDHLDPESWTRHEVEDVRDFLMTQFAKFPDTARIYHKAVSQLTDVTPVTEDEVEALGKMEGPFYVVVFPGDPVTWVVAAFLLIAAAVVITMAPMVAPPPPSALGRNQNAPSPNNELSQRTNQARINGRIPDIYGTVRSTPDLIAAPYKIFENNREVEYAYMCIGRGSYEVSNVRDGETLCVNIPGTSVMVYGPYNGPNMYDPLVTGSGVPQLTVGTFRQVPVLNTKRSNSINGQVLRPSNVSSFTGQGNIRFRYPNVIELPPNSPEDFTQTFSEGDEITITGASMEAGDVLNQILYPQVTMHDVIQKYPRNSSRHTYDTGDMGPPTGGGSLLIPYYTDEFGNNPGANATALFIPGSSVTLTQLFDTWIGPDPDGLDLSGTFNVASVSIDGPLNETEVRYAVPTLLIVRLSSPALINPDWGTKDGLNWRPELHYAPRLAFRVENDAGESYDFDVNGTYTIVSVTSRQIVVSNPSAVSADWELLPDHGGASPYMSPTIIASGMKWVGPFVLEDHEMISVFANFVAPNGLYKDNGMVDGQEAVVVEIELEVTAVNLLDEPIDDPEFHRVTMIGSDALKETVAMTLQARLSFFGRCQVRARRVTETDEDFEGTVVDEVRWRDLYSVSGVDETNFGNITTAMAITFATASALAVKERKLNMIVQRKVPDYVDGVFTDELTPSNDTARIMAAVCRDRYIGGRSLLEFDAVNFFATAAEVETYFGHSSVRQFCYTFDKDNLSFEEILSTIASSMFCVAYRRGNVIKLSFERLTDDSTLIFNHRNKLPGTEKRTISFGKNNDNDGVQYSYVDPVDDSINTVYLPPGYASLNPKKVESVGIRNHLQAYFHIWRVWNRIRYHNAIVEFDATHEADLLVTNDRILVSDGTRQPTQEGEVIDVDGTLLTLSQKVDLTGSPSNQIFLQLYDGTTESISVTAGPAANQVVLGAAPTLPLVYDADKFARTTFVIVGSTDAKLTAFLTAERTPNGHMVSSVTAINYDARYYANDTDYINDLIGEEGYGRGGGFTPGDGDEFAPEPEVTRPLEQLFYWKYLNYARIWSTPYPDDGEWEIYDMTYGLSPGWNTILYFDSDVYEPWPSMLTLDDGPCTLVFTISDPVPVAYFRFLTEGVDQEGNWFSEDVIFYEGETGVKYSNNMYSEIWWIDVWYPGVDTGEQAPTNMRVAIGTSPLLYGWDPLITVNCSEMTIGGNRIRGFYNLSGSIVTGGYYVAAEQRLIGVYTSYNLTTGATTFNVEVDVPDGAEPSFYNVVGVGFGNYLHSAATVSGTWRFSWSISSALEFPSSGTKTIRIDPMLLGSP